MVYNLIFQFKNRPILVMSGVSFQEMVAMVDLHGKDMISCQIEKVNNG